MKTSNRKKKKIEMKKKRRNEMENKNKYDKEKSLLVNCDRTLHTGKQYKLRL